MNGRGMMGGLVLLLAAASAAAAEKPADVVFEPGFFAALRTPEVLVYRYELSSEAMKEPYVSRVRVEIRSIEPDGTKRVVLDMFDGPNHRRFGPIPVTDQNPVILAMLQKDVATMHNLTGGAQGYFQQQIRLAFGVPVTVEPAEIEYRGHRLRAKRVEILPFEKDPGIARFIKFRDKRYRFVVSDAVPGGLYRMEIELPDPKNPDRSVLHEALTLQGVVPVTAQPEKASSKE